MSKAQNRARQGQRIERGPLSRLIRIDEIKDGEEGLIEPSAAERSIIAGMLDLVALNQLALSYRLRRHGSERIGLIGALTARATQTCVVTLAPLPANLELPVEVEFRPERFIQELEAAAAEPANHGMLDWPEPIVDGKIDLGPVVYESLATGLDLYPRAAGASLAWPDDVTAPAGTPEAPKGPFAALERLKPR